MQGPYFLLLIGFCCVDFMFSEKLCTNYLFICTNIADICCKNCEAMISVRFKFYVHSLLSSFLGFNVLGDIKSLKNEKKKKNRTE